MPAVLTLVGSHADLQLEGVKAGDQEDHAKSDHRHQQPDPFGNQECRQKESSEKRGHGNDHNDPHVAPNDLILLFQFLCHVYQKLFIFLIVVFHTDFLPT